MVLVNLYELWCCWTLTQPVTILKDFRFPPPSSRISICPLYVKLVKPKKDLDSLAYGPSWLRYTEKCTQRINETYPPVGQLVDMLKMITRVSILFLLALRHLWVNLLCNLTRASRYWEKPEEFNRNRRTEFKTIYQDSITFPLEEG